jgi:hypothetical protein
MLFARPLFYLYEVEAAQPELNFFADRIDLGVRDMTFRISGATVSVGYDTSRAGLVSTLRQSFPDLTLPSKAPLKVLADSRDARWIDLHYDVATHATGFEAFGVKLRLVSLVRQGQAAASVTVTDGEIVDAYVFSLDEWLVSIPEEVSMQFIDRNGRATTSERLLP